MNAIWYKAIFDEKIRLNEKIKNFRKFGLSKQTKFLYVFTTEYFDVTTRPVEYQKYQPMIQRVEKQFGQLLKLAGKLPGHRYRFGVLHQFKEFERVVWVMQGGRRLKITTELTCSGTAKLFLYQVQWDVRANPDFIVRPYDL